MADRMQGLDYNSCSVVLQVEIEDKYTSHLNDE